MADLSIAFRKNEASEAARAFVMRALAMVELQESG
jgi:hypothetical protein